MAWLRLEDTFHDHPKFRRMAIYLDCSRIEAKGYVASLWSWLVRHSPDGDLTSLDPIDLTAAAGYSGDADRFLDALIKAGLVDKDDDGIRIHGWLKRAESFKAAEKKRLQRAADKKRPGTAKKLSPDSPGTRSKTVPPDPPDRPTHQTDLSVGPSDPTAGEPLKLFVQGYRDGCAEHMKKPISPGGATKARDTKLLKMLGRYPMREPETAGYWLARAIARSDHHKAWRNWDLGWVADKAERFEMWLNEGREMMKRKKTNGQAPQSPSPTVPPAINDAQRERNAKRARDVVASLGGSMDIPGTPGASKEPKR